jgi:hypothetical protein
LTSSSYEATCEASFASSNPPQLQAVFTPANPTTEGSSASHLETLPIELGNWYF